ncbi:MAG: squalene--hopene cyclase [Planctomycetota bacterium]
MRGFGLKPIWMFLALSFYARTVPAQEMQVGETISRDVLEVYSLGLGYLQAKQNSQGTWEAGEGNGPGTTALAVLAFLASGEDPNFGPYRESIRSGLRHIISKQSGTTGYMGPSMYHHGFATLALSEAYGVVDDEELFRASTAKNRRSLEEALELAIRAALTAQNRNGFGGWRYSPAASDADTSVSGSVMMGLLAARNAGFEIPEESVERAIAYFERMTARNGVVGYSSVSDGNGESMARSSIVNLVLSIAGRNDSPAYASTGTYLVANRDAPAIWPEYARYYQAQALFQYDVEAWRAWNTRVIQQLKKRQKDDGSFEGDLGVINSTSMNLLTLAVNFRFLPIYER